ncbi:transcriptional regulator, IclR family [Actinomadura meyerae]|uniref:Transcriptional regulator, IclR family n=1 Tax=Actinomadura meyerae TaxID=240840 RepID=A0A239NEM2_9ACTN|nr:IclR family transcriptional regulator [Actinomadura meyerae]SNT53341.1 transcriptional regulator, IclR family [Actinomadura meyerae]
MPRLNTAVTRALDVLELLMREDQPTLRELTDELGFPRTTVFELLNTLVARGYVTKSADEPARYSLGVRTFQLGSAFADRLDFVTLGRAAADALSEQVNETSHVAVLDGTDVVYIARAESRQKVRMVSAVGARLPAHCTAIGKALLAQLSADELRERYPPGSELARLTDKTISSVQALEKELELIRGHGYSIEECESNVDVCCAGAPVRDHTGDTVAAISVSVPEPRWTAKSREQWAALVVGAASSYSRRLGYQAPGRP